MERIQMPEIPMPAEEDWEYFCSFVTPQKYLQTIEISLKEENRFFCDFRFLKLIHWYTQQTEIRIKPNLKLSTGATLYRARIYRKEEDTKPKAPEFLGYGPDSSDVPPKANASSPGRANPQGIRYLYTASDIRAAIAEVNPLLKNEISVAEFSVLEDLKVLNFANISAVTVGTDDKATAWKRNLPLAFTNIFNVPQHNSENYFLCQYLSECAKNLGYDGIRFASSKIKIDPNQQRGINYIIFDNQKCKAVSSNIYSLENLTYTLFVRNNNGLFEPFEE